MKLVHDGKSYDTADCNIIYDSGVVDHGDRDGYLGRQIITYYEASDGTVIAQWQNIDRQRPVMEAFGLRRFAGGDVPRKPRHRFFTNAHVAAGFLAIDAHITKYEACVIMGVKLEKVEPCSNLV